MPILTVKLDRARAARLEHWSRRRKVSKSDVIRALTDRAEPIETGNDLIAWVKASEGRGLGAGAKENSEADADEAVKCQILDS
jgi:hypothetical protein